MKSYYLTLFDQEGEQINDKPIRFKGKTPERAKNCASTIARKSGAYSWEATDNKGKELK